MDEPEDEERQNQGVIKTVASPTLLAAILDESIEDKQTFQDRESSPQRERCLDSREPEKRTSVNMDEREKETDLVDSFVEDSLEFEEGSQDRERRKYDGVETTRDEISDNSSLLEGTLRKNTENKSMDSKPLNKAVKNKQIPIKLAQKPRMTDFIDMNKGNVIQKSGKSSYAAMYSQKLKAKQGNDKSRNEKESDFTEKDKAGKKSKEITWSSNASSSRQYSYATQERNSSLSNQQQQNFSNHEKSSYYNVNEPYMYIPSANTYNYAPPGDQSALEYSNEYLVQPYHAPYRDFGLRYSNYGHQTYMASSAAAYHRPGDIYLVNNQSQGYSSQSAPPGIPGRQALLDQVEFFPEQEHLLSQSLTNSQFINPQHIYQMDSILERRFVSEPQLMSVTHFNENNKDTVSGSANNTPRKPADYKPYTLKDYRQIKNEQLDTLGSLGPEIESDEYKDKITKLNKQKEYAELLRINHSTKKKQWSKKAAVTNPPAHQIQAEAKRQAAINYAKTVPKPKITDDAKQQRDPNQVKTVDNEKDVPLIEVLRMRHIKERNQVASIRNELIAKTQQ